MLFVWLQAEARGAGVPTVRQDAIQTKPENRTLEEGNIQNERPQGTGEHTHNAQCCLWMLQSNATVFWLRANTITMRNAVSGCYNLTQLYCALAIPASDIYRSW